MILTLHFLNGICRITLQIRQLVFKLHWNITLQMDCLRSTPSNRGGLEHHILGETSCIHHWVGMNWNQDILFPLEHEMKTSLNLFCDQYNHCLASKLQSDAISYYGGCSFPSLILPVHIRPLLCHLCQTPTVVGRNLTQSSKARSEFAMLCIRSMFVCVSYPLECYNLWQGLIYSFGEGMQLP